jgi:hypothetical protein
MKSRAIVGLAAFVLTLAVLLPLLFLLSRGAVSTSQYLVIGLAVMLMVLWTIPYAVVVDPLLRRGVGSLLGVTIEWQGTSNSLSWTAVEETGCLLGVMVVFLGYLFMVLWFTPLVSVVALILWLRP